MTTQTKDLDVLYDEWMTAEQTEHRAYLALSVVDATLPANNPLVQQARASYDEAVERAGTTKAAYEGGLRARGDELPSVHAADSAALAAVLAGAR